VGRAGALRLTARGGKSPWDADTRDIMIPSERAKVFFAIIAIGVVVVVSFVALAVVLM
jgi:hypothetical protein